MEGLPSLDAVWLLGLIVLRVQHEHEYTHQHGDLNREHRVIHQAVLTACPPLPGSSIREILVFLVTYSSE